MTKNELIAFLQQQSRSAKHNTAKHSIQELIYVTSRDCDNVITFSDATMLNGKMNQIYNGVFEYYARNTINTCLIEEIKSVFDNIRDHLHNVGNIDSQNTITEKTKTKKKLKKKIAKIERLIEQLKETIACL